MVNQTGQVVLLAPPDSHLERIECEFGVQGVRHAPAHDKSAEYVNYQGDVHKATPGAVVGEISDPVISVFKSADTTLAERGLSPIARSPEAEPSTSMRMRMG
jgi:hypothetical protein